MVSASVSIQVPTCWCRHGVTPSATMAAAVSVRFSTMRLSRSGWKPAPCAGCWTRSAAPNCSATKIRDSPSAACSPATRRALSTVADRASESENGAWK